MTTLTVSRPSTKPILLWSLALLALMVFDVLVSAGVIAGHPWQMEGNPIAASLGIWWIALLKIVFAIALSLYSLWRNSAKALKLASLIMLGLAAWNVAMLLVFRY